MVSDEEHVGKRQETIKWACYKYFLKDYSKVKTVEFNISARNNALVTKDRVILERENFCLLVSSLELSQTNTYLKCRQHFCHI